MWSFSCLVGYMTLVPLYSNQLTEFRFPLPPCMVLYMFRRLYDWRVIVYCVYRVQGPSNGTWGWSPPATLCLLTMLQLLPPTPAARDRPSRGQCFLCVLCVMQLSFTCVGGYENLDFNGAGCEGFEVLCEKVLFYGLPDQQNNKRIESDWKNVGSIGKRRRSWNLNKTFETVEKWLNSVNLGLYESWYT